MNQNQTTHVRRLCGLRTKGDIYAYVGFDPNGIPLDEFLVCPPWEVNPHDLGMAPQGVTIADGSAYGRTGIYDLLDWVGSTNYPYVPDFIEEGKRLGFSRKIPRTTQFDLLSPESRHLFGHSKASLRNWMAFQDDRLVWRPCPQHHENHEKGVESFSMCLGHLWDMTGEHLKDERQYVRELPEDVDFPEFSYEAAKWPAGTKPDWAFAIFMWLPIQSFEVIKDDVGNRHEQALDLLNKSGTQIPFYLVEE